MMTSRCLLWVACACVFGACTGDELSVGDVRCIGDGVECDPPEALPQNSIPMPVEQLLSSKAELQWQTDLPCPDDECAAGTSSLLVHTDGSTTVAVLRLTSPNGKQRQDVWVGRFDPDGVMLGEDRLAGTESDLIKSTALARGADDEAVLAVLSNDAGGDRLLVYTISDHGKARRLFETEGSDALSAIAIDRKDLLVAGYYWTHASDTAPLPELARYRRDGSLVWRQSSLREHSDANLAETANGPDTQPPMPLVVDEHGRATLAIPEYRGSSLVAVGRDGNVDWSTGTANVESRRDYVVLPALELDSANRPLLAGPLDLGTGGESSYGVEQFYVTLGREVPVDVELVLPNGHDYAYPYVLGFGRDASDRMLVATRKGNLDSSHFVFERISADHRQLETFLVPGLDVAPGLDAGIAAIDKPLVDGIRVGGDGSVYFWRADRIGRITLPEPRP